MRTPNRKHRFAPRSAAVELQPLEGRVMMTGAPAVVLASISADLTAANGASSAPAISSDGRFVAFVSSASNLVTGDTNSVADIFLYDKQTGSTQRVSVSSQGDQANGASTSPAISADGRYIVFTSSASNLVSADTNAFDDIFVYDRQLQTTQRVSVDGAGAQANDRSQSPAISADGRFIAYASRANNLSANDNNSAYDIFRYELANGAVARVSVGNEGNSANFFSDYPALSSDGRFVVFSSVATNLVENDTNNETDVFVRDLTNSTTTRVSLSNLGAQAQGTSQKAAISSDGRYIAFESSASNLVADDTNSVSDVFLRDTLLSTTTRASISSTGIESNGISNLVSLSGDGQLVAFSSVASNLVPNDTNNSADVFVFGVASASTQRLSLTNTRAQANASSTAPAISSDGRFIAFSSAATNLITGDDNALNDIYIAGVNLVPVIGSVTDGPDPVKKPGNLTLSAIDVADSDGQVNSVLFYRDANNNGVLDLLTDTLLATDSDGSNGWSVSVSTNTFSPGINGFFAVAKDDFNDLGDAIHTTTTVVVSKAFDSRTVAKFKDASGDTVVIRLNGPGAGEVLLTAEDRVDPSKIILTSTTDKTTLSITVGGPGAKKTTIGDILVTGSLRAITATTTTLTGAINIAGPVTTITMFGVTGVPHTTEDDGFTGASITLAAAPDPRDTLTLKFGRVRELSVNSGMPIKMITVTDWQNEDGVLDTIVAPWVSKVMTKGNKKENVAGDFEAGFNLSGTLNPKKTLDQLTVKGNIGDSQWDVVGDVNKVTAAGFSSGWVAHVSVGVASITTTTGDLVGTLTAKAIGTIKVKRDMRNAHLTLTQPTTIRGLSLSSLAITGVMADSSIHAAGNVGAISTQLMNAVTIFAGVNEGVTTLPTLAAQFAAPAATINNITVKGTKIRDLASYTGSLIAAGVLKNVSLKLVDTSEGQPEYGVAGLTVKVFTRTGAPRRVDLTSPGEYDQAGSFVLRVPADGQNV